jgi:hypothetical protein
MFLFFFFYHAACHGDFSGGGYTFRQSHYRFSLFCRAHLMLSIPYMLPRPSSVLTQTRCVVRSAETLTPCGSLQTAVLSC